MCNNNNCNACTDLSESFTELFDEQPSQFKELTTISERLQVLPDFLRQDVFSTIMDMAGVSEWWKRRFSNDVVLSIDKGHRFVGWLCDYHQDQYECECDEEHWSPCANCYSYGTDLCRHTRWDHASYEDMKTMSAHCSLIACPYLPLEVFKFVFIYNLDGGYVDEYKNIRLALRKLNKERVLKEQEEGGERELW